MLFAARMRVGEGSAASGTAEDGAVADLWRRHGVLTARLAGTPDEVCRGAVGGIAAPTERLVIWTAPRAGTAVVEDRQGAVRVGRVARRRPVRIPAEHRVVRERIAAAATVLLAAGESLAVFGLANAVATVGTSVAPVSAPVGGHATARLAAIGVVALGASRGEDHDGE